MTAAILAFAALALALLMVPAAAAQQLGRSVDNTGIVALDVNGTPVEFNTNTVSFIVEARRTPSNIEFFRYAPAGSAQFTTRIHGSDYLPGGQTAPGYIQPGSTNDPFSPIGPARTSGGLILDVTGGVPLAPATSFLSGELMFVRVSDPGQNVNPNVIETLVIEIRTSRGDVIVLRLYESGPDTGEFFAYVPSSRETTAQNDNVLTAPADTRLTATYVDAFDATEVSVDTALVDPFGRVFDSLTGELLNGVEVTIIDVATGLPATVFGMDGVSVYPSILHTGSVVTDASGLQYPLRDGEFLFPLMAPGQYRLQISPPPGYFYPSGFQAADFENLTNAPFVIIDASYGGNFGLTAAGPINFDVPLDGAGEIVLTKQALTATASAGDTVGYAIDIENNDAVPAPVIVRDTLPEGFRYLPGSLRSVGGTLGEVTVSNNGRDIFVRGGVLRPGERLRLTYAATLTAGVRVGEAINTAVGINTAGAPISNRAEAAIEVTEDLLRSRLTLIGRVAEAACDADEDWAKELKDGLGVAGVRLYMETGEYVVSDENGLFHFEGVKPGVHVVQIDEKTLPDGYRPMVCEENSRYAQSPTSKFIDVRPGLIWRANFYLEKVADVEKAPEIVDFNDVTEYQNYDAAWLAKADPTPRWVYPETGRTPSSQSVNVGIVHPSQHTVELLLNGKPVPQPNFGGRETGEGPAELSRWRGVDILPGENVFTARVRNGAGEIVATLTETIWYVSAIERARLIADQTVLIADGRTPPVIALRIEDAAGRAVHKGRIVDAEVLGTYQLQRVEHFEREAVVTANTQNSGVVVGADGIARIVLEPTLQTGQVRVRVTLDSGRVEELSAWVMPEKRDWILVGLAEGALSLDKKSGALGTAEETLSDGRVAFFAKGMIRGDWLLTLAVDTAKRRGQTDTEIFADYIDPNAYYTLYGDRTFQYSDAQSQYPVYVKLEKETAQLLFGDFDTDLNDSVLARYSRRLSGFKSVFLGRFFSFSGFAAETTQGFVKDELAADGTSGPYRLSRKGLVRNAEVVRVETRDRLRPDRVLASRAYNRWIDYEIDYTTGEIIFRHPVAAADLGFNPNVIVVDYESRANDVRKVTAGGRASVHTEDRRYEAGVTYLKDDTADATELAGVDLKAKLTEKTELRAEVATSTRDTGTGTERADAYLLEATRQSEALTVSGYFRQEEAGFGVGQTGSGTETLRRLGVEARAKIDDDISESDGQRVARYVEGRAYRDESLTTGASRDVGEATIVQESASTGISVGLKAVEENYPVEGEARDSLLVTGSYRRTFSEQGLTVTASHEQPLNADDDGATLFPQRTQFGIDKIVSDAVTLNLRHEINNGTDASGDITTAGVTVKPWTGAEARLTADHMSQDLASRLAATVGLDQTVQVDDQWSASLGFAHRARIDGGDAPRDVAPDAALSPLEDGVRSPLAFEDSFTSAYVGAGFRAEKAAASVRTEWREGDDTTRLTAALGAARESSETLSYGAAARWQTEDFDALPGRESFDARLGLAFRPRGEGAVIFNRFDVRSEKIEGELDTRKLVNNLGINMMLTDQTQAALAWGIKYQEAEIGDLQTSGITQLFVGEVRHDITRTIDIGLSGSALVDHQTGTQDYSWGPSLGITPAENIWLSVGYNFDGFEDRDFEAAEYANEGVYLKLRIKFDEKTAAGLLERLSPSGD